MSKKASQGKSEADKNKQVDLKTSKVFHEIEEDYHSSSAYGNVSIISNPRDIKQKLMIARNILVESKVTAKKIQQKKPDTNKSILEKLIDYTKLSKNELKHIKDHVRTRDWSFEKALADIKGIPYPTKGLIADDIRNILVNFIISKKKFPSIMDLLRELKPELSKYTKETVSIQRLIKNKLIMYNHFPEFNRYLLSENPERAYQRTVYLNKIKQCRLQNKKLVYVEVKRLVTKSSISSFIAGVAAFPDKDILDKFFTKDLSDMIATKWLQQRIIPLIESGSIVVLIQPIKRDKGLIQGKKRDLLAWLDANEIPYASNAHTAELYDLYKKFKGKVGQYRMYDHIFLNAGIEVIPCIDDWRQLNFFKRIWADVELMDSYHTSKPEALKQIICNAIKPLMPLAQTEEDLILAESKMWEADQQMELILENTREMAKKGELQMQDLPEDCCGDKTDCLEIHIGDIIMDMDRFSVH